MIERSLVGDKPIFIVVFRSAKECQSATFAERKATLTFLLDAKE